MRRILVIAALCLYASSAAAQEPAPTQTPAPTPTQDAKQAERERKEREKQEAKAAKEQAAQEAKAKKEAERKAKADAKAARAAGERVAMGGGAEQAVSARVQEFLAALRKADEAALAPFYSDDYTITVAEGGVQTKAERLAWTKANAARLGGLEYHDLKTRVYGDTAVVTGHATGSVEGAAPINSRFIQVWVKQGGVWRLVAGQVTNVAPSQ